MRRRETSPREGTGMGRLLRESSRRRPDPHGGVGRRRPSPSPLALRARYERDGPTALTESAGTTKLHSCCIKTSAKNWAALATTVAEEPRSVKGAKTVIWRDRQLRARTLGASGNALLP